MSTVRMTCFEPCGGHVRAFTKDSHRDSRQRRTRDTVIKPEGEKNYRSDLGRVSNGNPSWRTDMQANANPGQRLENEFDLSGGTTPDEINGANEKFWAKRSNPEPQELGFTSSSARTGDSTTLIGNMNADNERFWAARNAGQATVGRPYGKG